MISFHLVRAAPGRLGVRVVSSGLLAGDDLCCCGSGYTDIFDE